jgi:hypothetical protein
VLHKYLLTTNADITLPVEGAPIIGLISQLPADTDDLLKRIAELSTLSSMTQQQERMHVTKEGEEKKEEEEEVN